MAFGAVQNKTKNTKLEKNYEDMGFKMRAYNEVFYRNNYTKNLDSGRAVGGALPWDGRLPCDDTSKLNGNYIHRESYS